MLADRYVHCQSSISGRTAVNAMQKNEGIAIAVLFNGVSEMRALYAVEVPPPS